jgi:RNA recognition motif-containing protein
MKLLIRNLARKTTEAEIRTLFEDFGTVQSCTLVIDKKSGQSKGFGFIEIPKAGEAKVAIKNLNGKEVDGNIIRVKKATPPFKGYKNLNKNESPENASVPESKK